jgi:cytochrome c
MPFHAPQSLKPDEVYGITAYLLFLNQIIPENEILDAKTLPKVVMPNRYGFISDPRPDLHNNPCRDSCKP